MRVPRILRNGRQRHRHTARQMSNIVIIEIFDLGAASTESTLKTLGPQSVNSTCSLSCIFGELLALLTRAETPSAPRLRAPPTAIYFPVPLSTFEALYLMEPFG